MSKIRELTCGRGLPLPPEAIVQGLSRFPRGRAAYFRFGDGAACRR